MNALLATYLAFNYMPADGAVEILPGVHHSPVPLSAAARKSTCETAWGERYPIGQQLQLGALNLHCNYVSTWVDGRYLGDSVRWIVSAE